MILPRETIKVRRYKAGYEIRDELVDDSEYGGTGFVMKSAYNPSGDYIGESKWGYRLCKKFGIAPEKITADSNICSIGFCEKEQKWYGWSHRALFGFGVGSECKKGSCHYQPTDPQDLMDDMKRFWVDVANEFVTKDKILRQELDVQDPDQQRDGLGALLEVECTRKVDKKVLNSVHWWPYPDVWGKGEWTAKTLEDGKQMAIDFARGVS